MRQRSEHDDPTDRLFAVLFAIWFAICGLFSLAVTGLSFWAVITLIQWVTTK